MNYLTQSTVILGGVTDYYLSGTLDGTSTFLLPFAAGNFIYIASSDLIPEIKREENVQRAAVHFAVFLIGIGVMFGLKFLN